MQTQFNLRLSGETGLLDAMMDSFAFPEMKEQEKNSPAVLCTRAWKRSLKAAPWFFLTLSIT